MKLKLPDLIQKEITVSLKRWGYCHVGKSRAEALGVTETTMQAWANENDCEFINGMLIFTVRKKAKKR